MLILFLYFYRYVYHGFHAFVSCYVGTEARLSVNLVPQLKDVGCSNGEILSPCTFEATYSISVLISCGINEAACVFIHFVSYWVCTLIQLDCDDFISYHWFS